MDISYQIPRAALIWVIVSVVLVLLPQGIRMPIWLTFICLVCIGWRLLIFAGKVNYPGKRIRVTVVLFTLFVPVSQMGSIGLGLDSAASLLTLGFVFKLIEMRYKRDIYVVLSLCFVMTMVSFLYSQGVVATAFNSIVVVVIVCAMIALNRSNMVPGGRGTVRLAIKIAFQALPLTIVLFVLFPRIAPLWAVPMQSNSARTGVSDEMSPGDISQLGRSAELAFRVQFENSAPLPHEELYWRGLVLDDYDGSTWRRTRSSSAYGNAAAFANFRYNWDGRMETTGAPIRYNVIMEPTQQPWIYGLHLAEPQTGGIFRSRNFEMFNSGLVTQRISYDLQSFLNNQTDVVLTSSPRRNNTELPEEGNPQSREFARNLRDSVNSDEEYVQAVLNHFASNPFFYTLNP
jgi:protein-glutamine gamma-glutamyltransferase